MVPAPRPGFLFTLHLASAAPVHLVMIDKSQQVVASVIASYQHAIRNRFVKPRVAPGSKTWHNALAFFQLQTTTKHSLGDLMNTAVRFYSKEWLKEMMGAKYPPFTMVVSEATRKRVARSFRPRERATPEQLMKQARDVAATLHSTMGAKALELAQAWPDEHLRPLIIEVLKEAP